MPSAFQFQCHFILIFLAASKGETRHLEVRDASEDEPFLLLSKDLKRELSARADLLVVALLLPFERFHFISINYQGGNFLKVFDGWMLKGEKFPSSLDHPLPTSQRYIDFCDCGNIQRSIRSLQNVSMIFRIHQPGNGFTITVKKNANIFRRFTVVIPHQHRNCSFSIIYPVVIKISDLILGHLSGLSLKKPSTGCAGVGDFVELLGGTSLDMSKMLLLADLCHSSHGSAQMKIDCDNTVLRMVSSSKHINRVTFEYYQVDLQETENRTALRDSAFLVSEKPGNTFSHS